MIQVRRSSERGHFDHGWLDTFHSFSFADYRDPAHMGFRSLRVLNEDRVAAGQGFGSHPHRDMEILTYVLSGALEHRDNLGNGGVIRPGEMQRITAGTGIYHSEFNPSPTDEVHLYQIWLFPERKGLTPGYQQGSVLPPTDERNRLRLVASPAGGEHAMTIRQDANVFVGAFDAGSGTSRDIPAGRFAWVQVLRGGVTLNGEPLAAGDGAAVAEESRLAFRFDAASEVMVFDLA